MNLTNEKIQAILDGAPDGATHYEITYGYLKTAKSGYMAFDDEGGDWDYEYAVICDTKSLNNLREILALRQEVERLKSELLEAAEIIDESTNYHALAESLRIATKDKDHE